MAKVKKKFISGAKKTNIVDKETAEEEYLVGLKNLLGTLFNKSHSNILRCVFLLECLPKSS